MLQSFGYAKQTKLMNTVRADIEKMFSRDVAEWIINNIMFINEYLYEIVNRATTW